MINVPFVIACVLDHQRGDPAGASARVGAARRVDVPGALLCAGGLAGTVFALIEQPRLGWSSPGVLVPLIGGVLLLCAFVLYEARASDPMLPLRLFRKRNFSAGNVETLAMYAGLAIVFFFLVLFLQQVAGYSPLAERPHDAARDDRDVHAVTTLRRARRPLRPAAVHGRRAARVRAWACSCSSAWART